MAGSVRSWRPKRPPDGASGPHSRGFIPFFLTCMFLTSGIGLFSAIAADDPHSVPHPMFDIPCLQCHDEEFNLLPLDDMAFNHDPTGFPLRGAHRQTACMACHIDMVFDGTPQECFRCHEDIHNGELGSECQRCHDATTFSRVEDFTGFHEATRFPLRGVHRTLMCLDCHEADGEYQWRGLNTDCAACHLEDYAGTEEPDHAAANFSTDCAKCHLPVPGFRAEFDHGITGTPLTGTHRILTCSDCHRGDFFTGLSTECVSCHLEDQRNATEPDHAAAGFPPAACEQCHTTHAWAPSTFDHAETGYALDGAHVSVPCSECHADNTYEGLPHDCVSCHRDEYDDAVDPDHAGLEFSLQCEECHTTAAWSPSLFDHAATVFPLAGAHLLTACGDCHTADYGLKPPDTCIVCHDEDYGDAPEHALLAFPEDCTECHSKDAWSPQPYDHPEFPIYSGHHSGEWNTCGACHTVSGDLTAFSCFECHLRQETNRQHSEEEDYEYVSAECLRCHPDGEE